MKTELNDVPVDELRNGLEAAFADHESAVAALNRVAQRLEAAALVPREEAERALRQAIDAGWSVREFLLAAHSRLKGPLLREDGTPQEQSTLDELRETVQETLRGLEGLARAIPLRRLTLLRDELRVGRIVRAMRPAVAEERRTAAISEVQAGLERSVPSFPGPDPDSASWLRWFWTLEEPEIPQVDEELRSGWPHLTEFLEMVRATDWHAGPTLERKEEGAGGSSFVATPLETVAARPAEAVAAQDVRVTLELARSSGGPDGRTQGAEAVPRPAVEPERVGPVPGPVAPAHGAVMASGTPSLMGASFKKQSATSVAASEVTTARGERLALPPSTVLTLATTVSSARIASPPPPAVRSSSTGPETGAAGTERAARPEGATPVGSTEPGGNPEPAGSAVSPPVREVEAQALVNPPRTSVHARPLNPGPEVYTLTEAMGLSRFKEAYWVSNLGTVEDAPWVDVGFEQSLARAQLDGLREQDWRCVMLTACASTTLPGADLAPARLVEWAVDYVHGRPFVDAEAAATALERAKFAVANVRPVGESPFDLLAACLSLLSTDFARATPAAAVDLVDLLDLAGGAKRFVDAWLEVGREGDPEEVLRSQIGPQAARGTVPVQSAPALEESLRGEIKRLASSAGGTVQRTHCRQAWDSFMGEALPILQAVANGQGDESLGRQLRNLPRVAEKVFDRGGAKFQDRRHMDKAVALLLDQAEALLVARAAAKEGAHRKSGGARFDEISLEALRQVASEPPGAGRLLLSLVATRLGLVPAPPRDLSFLQGDIAVRPLLLEAWAGFDLTELRLNPVTARDHRLAAARLLAPPLPTPIDDIPLWLASQRPDLLVQGEDLPAEVVRRVQGTQREMDEGLTAMRSELRRIVQDLAELADTQHARAQEALNVAEKAADGGVAVMDGHWLKHVCASLTRRTRELEGQLRAEALREEIPEEEVEAMLSSGQRAALIRTLRGHGAVSEGYRMRATLYRPDAAKRWPFPAQVIQRHSSELAADPALKALVDIWHKLRMPLRTEPPSEEHSLKVRQAFSELFFQARAKTRVSKVQHRSPRGMTHFSFVEMSDVREWVEEVAPNPNFLPQLSRFQQLTVKLAPTGTGGRSFGRRVAQEGSEGELTVVLAPGVEGEQLRAAKEQVAASGRAIAILDDLDICRIFNPGDEAPEPLLALLEIVSEQQSWLRFCPYEVVEGQHIRLEMFVGRAKEAKQLAHQATYGRIFSGRRLGKTALLRFVGGKESLRVLPSRNSLSVVFCSIAGLESEASVATAIERAILEHFRLKLPPAAREVPAVARLDRIFKQLLDGDPTLSVLCLLDEADTFYAEQTSAAASERQDSLSWWMSRHAEEARDAAQLPRLRFVFCGYLCTDQNRGVWENKGDVLFLKPLDPEDAVRLAAAPLARIGIDAKSQADDIAFRCGYQPAVITRFGKELVDQMDRTRPRQNREMATVEPRDVITVFQSNEVQRAVREACWLNFVGHPLGQLVFSGLLMVLRDRPPGAAVEDAPTLIREAVRAVDPGFDRSVVAAGSWEDVAFQLLRELVDRSLLVQAGFAPAAFRLRFPHHLPVLLQEDPARYVVEALARIRAGASTGRPSWVLPQATLHSISYALGPEARELGLKAVVVASQWPEALLPEDGGLVQRLEVGATDLRVRVRTGPAAERAASGLEDADAPLLVVGGVAVARAAAARHQGYGDVELAKTGRLTEEQVTSWIQRKRAAEFTAQAAHPMKEIMRRTSGIPVLLAEVDRWLVEQGDAPTLGKVEVDGLMTRLDAAIPVARSRLSPGGGPEALTEREAELVALLAYAWDQHGDEFREALEEGLVEVPDRPSVEHFGPADHASLRMLMALGLVPRAPLGTGSPLQEVGPVLPTDPIRSLLGLSA